MNLLDYWVLLTGSVTCTFWLRKISLARTWVEEDALVACVLGILTFALVTLGLT